MVHNKPTINAQVDPTSSNDTPNNSSPFPCKRKVASLLVRGFIVILLGISALLPADDAKATCLRVLQDGDFEQQRSNVVSDPWIAEGRTGIDLRQGLSFRGTNNAWARNNVGWNAIRQPVRLFRGQTYTLIAFVRSSGNVRDGYFGFRDSNQRPVAEIRFGPLPTYQQLRVQFRPNATGTFNVFAGFWAPTQDAWIQIDNVSVSFPCEDNFSVPENGGGMACWAREFFVLKFCNVTPTITPSCPTGSILVRSYPFSSIDHPDARQNFTFACVSRRADDPGDLPNCTDAYGSHLFDGDRDTINRACLDAP